MPMSDSPKRAMLKPNAGDLTFGLAAIAAVLALVAAVVGYLRSGVMRWELIAAAVFILAFGLGARGRGNRIRQRGPSSDS